jgi:hypothetical protein
MRTAVLGIFLSLTALGSAPALAQAITPAKPNAPRRLFVDSVVASVNDSSILQSKLFKASSGQVQGQLAQGNRLTLDQIRNLTVRELRKLVTDHQMAQSARSFGNFSPDRFDAILKSELDRDQQDRVRELGTEFAVSEELARNGETWQTHRNELRTAKLTMLAESFAIHERLRKQSNLYLTPRMLRETYKEFRSEFVKEAIADTAMVVCTGPSAESNAKEASKLWQTGDWTAREVAEKFPGVFAGVPMPARTLGTQLKAFGMAGPVGKVSEPIRGPGGTFKVAKSMKWQAASDGRFEDPEVQALVRRIATRKVHLEFELQAQQRARDRTNVWVYENGRRTEFPFQ